MKGASLTAKIKSRRAMAGIARRLRADGKKIVFTNGCFDILHRGHVVYLEKASRMGDALIVGLNSDRSVRAIKGPSRPVNGELARASVLAALSSVTYVTIFGEETPEKVIKLIRPDVLVKGGDWGAEKIVGSDFVKSLGGRVARIPFVKGYSTTSTIKRMSR